VVIDQAKSMLAETGGVTPAEALTTLRACARRRNLRLLDVAHAVIDREPWNLAVAP
jgi:AmiR/NasT family two-component response regulator